MQQYNGNTPLKTTPPKKRGLKIALAGVVVLIVSFLLGIQFSRPKNPPTSSLPPASPPPPVNLPPGDNQASQTFIWGDVTIPEPTKPVFLYTITTPFTAFGGVDTLISLLGFIESNKVINEATQKVWSNESGSLSVGTSPQYFTYSAKSPSGLTLEKTRLFAAFTGVDNVKISEPVVTGTTVSDRITGTSTAIQVETYDVQQTIDDYPLISSSKLNIGNLVFNQTTGGLMNITIASGYRTLQTEGSAVALTKEELILKASRMALGVNTDTTIAERSERNNAPQRIRLSSVEIVYYNNSNDLFVRPGYLLTGINLKNQKVFYFVPML